MSILIIVAVNPKMRVFPPSQKVAALLNLCFTSSLWIGQNQVESDSKVVKMPIDNHAMIIKSSMSDSLIFSFRMIHPLLISRTPLRLTPCPVMHWHIVEDEYPW